MKKFAIEKSYPQLEKINFFNIFFAKNILQIHPIFIGKKQLQYFIFLF
jgi:hypothetical protein